MPSPDRADLVIRAPRILTMSGAGIVEDGCVAVAGGSIIAVGRSCPPSERELNLAHHAVMPGLVDSHAYTYMLAVPPSASPEDFRPGADLLYWSALFAYTTMLLSGVTAVRDSAHDPAVLAEAARRSGIRAIPSMLVDRRGATPAGWPELTVRAVDPGAAPPPGARVFLDASELDPLPSGQALQSAGISAVVGAFAPLGDLRRLWDAGIGVVVTPSQALRGRWSGGVLKMRSVGVSAALGTGARSLRALPNLLEEARIAMHMDAMLGFDPNPQFLLESMTSSAGAVLGERVGRIEPGFRADIVALDLRRPHLRFPSGDLLSLVVSSATRGDFDYVIVDGNVVVEEGRHKWLYLEGIARKLESIIGSSWAGGPGGK
ncbi:MAG: amidohydrolase family protein [Conexivisphaera sp.]